MPVSLGFFEGSYKKSVWIRARLSRGIMLSFYLFTAIAIIATITSIIIVAAIIVPV